MCLTFYLENILHFLFRLRKEEKKNKKVLLNKSIATTWTTEIWRFWLFGFDNKIKRIMAIDFI